MRDNYPVIMMSKRVEDKDTLIQELKDRLHRRNLQIKDLKAEVARLTNEAHAAYHRINNT